MAQKNPVNYGTRLEEARNRLGWTDEETWIALGVSDTTWYRWKGTGLVPPARIGLIWQVLGVRPLDPPKAAQREWALEEKLSELEGNLAGVRQATSELREDLSEVRQQLSGLLQLQRKGC